MRQLRGVLGVVLGAVARLWMRTLRIDVEVHPLLAAKVDVPWILSFFHGTQWSLLAWYLRFAEKRAAVLVSLSHDGDVQARALTVLGLRVVRGSSSRGGARGLAALLRRVKHRGENAAFAVDGPRGPYGSVKPGALLAATKSGGVLVPIGAAVSRGLILRRAWDRFAIAWPFSRVTVVLGAPLDGSVAPDELGSAIAKANAGARANLAGTRTSVVRFDGVSSGSPPASHPR